MRLKFCVPELDTASSPSTHNLLHRFSLRSLLSQIFGLSSQALTLESRPVEVVALSTTLSSSLSRRPYQAHSLKSLPSQAHSPYDPLKLTLPTTLSSSLSRVLSRLESSPACSDCRCSSPACSDCRCSRGCI
ncbi:hypothetical protein F2Q70_00039386 [Brassica cretica]|uniref:Uncharacterized protein n=1 Tax=Brassica cretica TaxID=69181 RepID=A0A8S9KC80_BRACR|nr:hypothetical protein F2Q70_00039386 [Brassica cretica]